MIVVRPWLEPPSNCHLWQYRQIGGSKLFGTNDREGANGLRHGQKQILKRATQCLAMQFLLTLDGRELCELLQAGPGSVERVLRNLTEIGSARRARSRTLAQLQHGVI